MSDSFFLIVRYSLFAVFAMVINLVMQWLSFFIYDGAYAVFAAMISGTIVGLIAKYMLDKNWIFMDDSRGVIKNGKKFIIYASMGLATTLLFWAFELVFDYIFSSDAMRYIGAIAGLSIGYIVKYCLDRRFVFVASAR